MTNAAYAEPMSVEDYSAKALTTAIYPGRNETGGVLYATLGLVGEVGETGELFLEDKDFERSATTPELGDVLWYINALADELEWGLPGVHNEVCYRLGIDVANIFLASSRSAIPWRLHAELVVKTGAIANKVKKALRDDKGVITEDRASHLRVLLSQAYEVYIQLVWACDLDLHAVMVYNIDKLFDRKQRGALGGDGDKR
jgi:NTP pyrophosphatase (non-canonical NTP hydrolase)